MSTITPDAEKTPAAAQPSEPETKPKKAKGAKPAKKAKATKPAKTTKKLSPDEAGRLRRHGGLEGPQVEHRENHAARRSGAGTEHQYDMNAQGTATIIEVADALC
jgi:hypothetical protein